MPIRFSGRCRQATKPAATNDQPIATCTGAGRVSASGSRIAMPIANRPRAAPSAARKSRAMRRSSHGRTSMKTPKSAGPGFPSMRTHDATPTFDRVPERRKRDEEDPPDHIPDPPAVALGAAGLLAALGAFSGSIDDPTVAPCRRPPTTVSAPRVVLDHREALVRFTCNETQLSGTLYLPLRPGPHPRSSGCTAAANSRGSPTGRWWRRSSTTESRSSPTTSAASPTRRAAAARTSTATSTSSPPTRSARSRPFAPRRPWTTPRLASSAPAQPAGSHRARRRSRRTSRSSRSPAQASSNTASSRASSKRPPTGRAPTSSSGNSPHGSRPASTRRRTSSTSTSPALWLFGGGDRNVPPLHSVARLRSIKQQRSKDWTIVVFPGAGHGLFDEPPTDPRAAPTAEAWVRDHVHISR